MLAKPGSLPQTDKFAEEFAEEMVWILGQINQLSLETGARQRN